MSERRCETCGTPLMELALDEACPQCMLELGFETGPENGHLPPVTPLEPQEGTTLFPSSRIARYRIIRIIGEGGMGVVYEAEQEHPRRTVALKIVRPGLATPELLRRFELEAEALGRLQHPAIAQIYEAGTADLGSGPQPYFAMELIRGVTPREYAEKRHLDTRGRMEILAKIADGVQHAHQRGLIHRDLKPANIIVDETGQPKILDFGVARVIDREAQTTMQTGLGQLVGTLAYMSPEQVSADPLELDTRSDVYSLGILFYELLTGRLPYDVKKMIHEAARAICEEDPTRLSAISRTYRGDIETIASKALEKDKNRRYGSAAELAADIRHYLKDEPIVARPPSTAYQLHKFARRHRAIVAGVSAAFAVLVAGVVVSSWLAARAHRAELTAVNERNHAKQAQSSAERSAAAETAARGAADAARTEAEMERVLAQEALSTAQRNLYFNNIDLSEREWLAGNTERVDRLLAEAPESLRNWEWRYLAHASHMEEAVLHGHRGAIRALVFDADGNLRTVSADNTVKIWDIEKHKEISTLPLSGNAALTITDAAFSPNGRMLYLRRTSAGNISERKIWDLAAGKEGLPIPYPASLLASIGLGYGPIAFTVDNRLLVAGGSAAAPIVQSYDLKTGQEQSPFALYPGAGTRLLLPSADGTRLAALTETGVKVMGAYGGENVIELEHSQAAATPAISKDGRDFAAAFGTTSILGGTLSTRNDTMRSWNVSTGKERWARNVGASIVRIEFHPNSQLIAAALDDHTIRILDNTNGAEIARLTGHSGTVQSLRFTPDGTRLVSAGSDGTLRIWRMPATTMTTFDGGDDARPPKDAMVSPDGTMLLTLSGAILKVWDLNTKKLLIERHYDRTLQPRATGFTTDNRRVFVWVSRQGTVPADIRFIDIATDREFPTLHASGLGDFTLVPKSTRFALLLTGLSISSSFVGRTSSELQIWDSTGAAMVNRFSPKSGGDLQLSPDGMQAAILSSGLLANGQNEIAIYNVHSGKLLRRIEARQPVSIPIRFSPDSKRVAAVTNGRGVTIWDSSTGGELVSLGEHKSNVSAIAFSPDGSRLISVSLDQEARIWESNSGRPLLTLRNSSAPYGLRQILVAGAPARGERSPSISFSADGNRLRLDTVTTSPKGLIVQTTTWDAGWQ